MGRKGRMLREAVAAGRVPTVRQHREWLMQECIRLAMPRLFLSPDWDKKRGHEFTDAIVGILLDVLPEALDTAGRRTFTVAELTTGEDWDEMVSRVIQGVASRHESFRKMDRNGDYWRIRKGKSGRKPTGQWVLCLGCGVPRWATPARATQRCRACWLAHQKQQREQGRAFLTSGPVRSGRTAAGVTV